MANEKVKKQKKKSLADRIIFDDEKPEFTPEAAQVSKWSTFKSLFFGRFGTMVLTNIFTLLFALPGILVYLLFYLNSTVASGYIAYSGNIGIGYPVVVDAVANGLLVDFQYTMMQYVLLVPCISFFALGVSGNLYVMRKLLWEEETKTFKDFFRGIKKSWLGSLFIGFAVGMTILFFVFSLDFYDVYKIATVWKVLSLILASVLLVFISIFASYFLTQNVAFKLRLIALLRNSLLFTVGTNIQAIIFVGIALIPFFLTFIPGITILIVMIYMFLGFSFTTLVITLYCHSNYEHTLYNRAAEKGAAVYGKRDDKAPEGENGDAPAASKRKAPTPYKNPKKRRKSIDEGSNITPLAPTFRREDLERLQREHEQILSEEEQERAQLDGESVDPNATGDTDC